MHRSRECHDCHAALDARWPQAADAGGGEGAHGRRAGEVWTGAERVRGPTAQVNVQRPLDPSYPRKRTHPRNEDLVYEMSMRSEPSPGSSFGSVTVRTPFWKLAETPSSSTGSGMRTDRLTDSWRRSLRM